MYDWANSAMVTLIVTAVFPIFYKSVSAAGLPDAESGELAVEVRHASFEDWWEPYTFGIGPAGAYVAALSPGDRKRLEHRCRDLLPEPPFTTRAVAHAARAVVPGER